MRSLAVFYDCENIDGLNIESKVLSLIISHINTLGVAIMQYGYADWSHSNMLKWKTLNNEHGIINEHCDTIKNKNSVDLKMALDVQRILYTRSHIDMFVIVSSDFDFRHLAKEIKENGRLVYGIGYKRDAIHCIEKHYTAYTYIDDIIQQDSSLSPNHTMKSKSKKKQNGKIEALEKELINIKNDNDKLKEENDELQKQSDRYKNETNRYKEEIDRYKEERTRLKVELRNLNKALERKQIKLKENAKINKIIID
tara:strand:+ start:1007 stop:1768 length:762 start_codon:yes stop_codon:yes gene_type:complete